MTTPLAKLLYWDAMANRRTLINRDGTLMACVRFRGPDLHAALESELVVQADQLNNTFRRLEGGWGLLSEARRREARTYPAATWRHPAAQLVDAERRGHFTAPGQHYLTETTLTFTWKKPRASSHGLTRLLYTDLPPEEDGAGVRLFEEQIRRIVALLSDAAEEVTLLEGSPLLTYLHGCISWQDYPVAVPDPACYLDTYLADTDLDQVLVLPHLFRWPKLGDRYLRCISAKAYPPATTPGMLDVLDTLPLEYRACVRYLPLPRAKALKEAQAAGDAHWGQRHRGKSTRTEQAAMTRADDAGAFQHGIDLGRWSAGRFTQTVVVWETTTAGAQAKAETVEATLNHAGYTAKIEGLNTMAAWDATLPGNVRKNRRTPILTSRNLAHLVPATSAARGPQWNTHLDGPPLLMVTGRGQTPYALDFHFDDTAHTFIVGPTGSGKSFLVALLCMQWLKYAGAQVYALDKDQSLRGATYAVGGDWYDIGAELERDAQRAGRLDDVLGHPLWMPPPGWWQCYEMASLLQSPGILPQVMGPLLRQMEQRLTGVPTLISLDEGWVWLTREFFAGKIQDYLLTLRKKNGMVLFSTPSLKHLIESPLGTDIYESCVNKIFLANPQALTAEVGRRYRDLGLTERECHLIATLARKRQYYAIGPHGRCVFELGAGPITVAYCGSGRKADLAAMDTLYTREPAGFARNWLLHKGLHEAAARLERTDDDEASTDLWTAPAGAVA
jgi:type IV secretory pathway VirB4 component